MKTTTLIFSILFPFILFAQGTSSLEVINLTIIPSKFSVSENKTDFYFIIDETNEIIKTNRYGKIQKLVGGFGWQKSQFHKPTEILSTSIEVFVCDYNNHRIQKFDRNLNFISEFSNSNTEYPFEYPLSIALSSKGDLFVLDSKNKKILKINGFGKLEKIFGNYENAPVLFQNPMKLRIDSRQNLFVLDNNNLFIFDQFGNYRSQIKLTIDDIIDFIPDEDKIFLLLKDKLIVLRDNQISIFFQGQENEEFKQIEIRGDELFLLTGDKLLLLKK